MKLVIFNSSYCHIQNDGRFFASRKYSLFLTLFYHKNSNCRSNLFRDVFVASSPLDRPRHSSLEINIFSSGTNTWFLTIDHRSITNLVHDSSPPHQKTSSCFSPVYLREEDPSPRRRAWPRSLKENMSKEFTKKAQLNFTTVQPWTIRPSIRTFDFCPAFWLLEFPLLLSSHRSYVQDVHIAGRSRF